MSDTDIDTLISLSRFYGVDPRFVIAGGGNTSLKQGGRLIVKASGSSLAQAVAGSFVELDRVALDKLLKSELSSERHERESQFKAAILASRIHPEKGQRPSVEALLHHLIPGKYVVHTHCTQVNMFTCAERGQQIIADLFGNEVVWIPEVDPGFVLARTLDEALAGRDGYKAILLQNHGLIVAGDSAEQIKERTAWLLDGLQKKLDSVGNQGDVFGRVARHDETQVRRMVDVVAPALRALLADGEALKIVTFDDSPMSQSLVCGASGKEVAMAGPLTPDQIVYCRSFPLWVEVDASEPVSKVVVQLKQAIEAHRQSTGTNPQVIFVKDAGLFAVGDDLAAARTVRDVYLDIVQVMGGAQRLGGIRHMAADLRKFIEDWEVEAYRKQISAGLRKIGRASGKVAIVTGAAQGFGLEISHDLAQQGAHVALGDINIEGTQQAADELNRLSPKPVAIALGMNVTDPQSVGDAVHQVVRTFGGFDLFVSNAGVLKAESVKTQAKKDFEFVTAVNYTGYFVCVQQASAVLSIQHLAKTDYTSDIIQINSKSGLVGSNRNGAYAGSKFGGIGLTQSFALELVEDGIKVNSICPGNFFDGPLWSDPTNGLFAQYLRSGKVPGAKTVADVKLAYESKVPMKRGCTTADVMKALYYLMDQKYETGQAVPVTGGQVMLS